MEMFIPTENGMFSWKISSINNYFHEIYIAHYQDQQREDLITWLLQLIV